MISHQPPVTYSAQVYSSVSGSLRKNSVTNPRAREITFSWVISATLKAGAEHAQVYQAIIDAASARKCDLIVMASHGRRGVSAVVLGSETVKVLTHSKIPVLVYR